MRDPIDYHTWWVNDWAEGQYKGVLLWQYASCIGTMLWHKNHVDFAVEPSFMWLKTLSRKTLESMLLDIFSLGDYLMDRNIALRELTEVYIKNGLELEQEFFRQIEFYRSLTNRTGVHLDIWGEDGLIYTDENAYQTFLRNINFYVNLIHDTKRKAKATITVSSSSIFQRTSLSIQKNQIEAQKTSEDLWEKFSKMTNLPKPAPKRRKK